MTRTMIVRKQKDLYLFDLCWPRGFSSLVEIMPLYLLWKSRSEPFNQCFCPPQLILGVSVYQHLPSVLCLLDKEFWMGYSKSFFSLRSMIVWARKRLSLQGYPLLSRCLLCFLLPTLSLEFKDTVWQFGQRLRYKLFWGLHLLYLLVSVRNPFTMYRFLKKI